MDGELGVAGRKPHTQEEVRHELKHELHEEARDPAHIDVTNEKDAVREHRISFDDLKDDSSQEDPDAIKDLFVSLPPIKGIHEEPNPLTVRAVVIGILLGSLVNASNVYLGKFLVYLFPQFLLFVSFPCPVAYGNLHFRHFSRFWR